jgi:hypothetical protein
VFELSICFRTCDLAGIWNQEIAEVWKQEITGIRGSRTGEALESWACEPTRSDLRNSGVTDGGLGNELEAKSKTLPKKSGFSV